MQSYYCLRCLIKLLLTWKERRKRKDERYIDLCINDNSADVSHINMHRFNLHF